MSGRASWRVVVVALGGALLAGRGPSARAAGPDAAFAKFWAARNPQDAEKAAADIVKSGVTFEDARMRLQRGRTFAPDAPRGAVRLQRRTVVGDFIYTVEVPETYDPARRYQVRVQLHGGVMMRGTGQPRGAGTIGALAGAEQIYIVPNAWRDAPWWSAAQEENVNTILDTVKRTYNVDENRVVLAGVSDGATAAYYFAMRDTTPFASFLPLNGSVMVLANESLGIASQLSPNNLLNKPFFVVNGDLDPLYPTGAVGPYLEHLARGGVQVAFDPQPTGVHNTAWWPHVETAFETFVREHPRQPYPDRVTWETDRADAHNRAHWLVIDKLRDPRGDAALPDLNDFTRDSGEARAMFRRPRTSGRVDLVRDGNVVDARTHGVAAFTLLLSPDVFDFEQPVKVVVNGHPVFDGRVERSVQALVKWAARDNDRTMLFGAELRVAVPD
jgi:acetyl esterase/lipase